MQVGGNANAVKDWFTQELITGFRLNSLSNMDAIRMMHRLNIRVAPLSFIGFGLIWFKVNMLLIKDKLVQLAANAQRVNGNKLYIDAPGMITHEEEKKVPTLKI